jgi:L-gulonolactone oxidase
VARPRSASRPLWRNWAGNQHCAPHAIERPTDEPSLVDVVHRAAEDGRRVKAVGAGHSFTAAACTDGHLVDLGGYGRLLHVDPSTARVTVEAGMPLHRLSDELADHGLALENLGDINYQSVAGATATATHGTGARFGTISSRITAMRLIDGSGQVVSCSADEAPDVFAAARVGVGALGLISTVTLQCVPAFNLHAVEEPAAVDEVLDQLDELVDGSDHYEFNWIPGTRWALTKRNTRTQDAVRPRPRWQAFRNDVLLDNVGFGAMMRLGRFRPGLIPTVARRLPSTGRQEYVDRSDRVFASPRLVRFLEMEYAVPREAFPAAFAELRSLVARLGVPIGFPVECRFVAGDDIALSTASGRDTAYLAVHTDVGMPHEQYFTGVEQIMMGHGGRPHWGKLHYRNAASLAPAYPRWDEFQAVRAKLDPDGRFANPYTDRIFGPVGA